MKRLALAALLLAVAPAMAQEQLNPAQSFVKQWRAVIANDTVTAVQREHVADSAQALADDWQKQRDELKKTKEDLSDRESRLQWVLDHWVGK